MNPRIAQEFAAAALFAAGMAHGQAAPSKDPVQAPAQGIFFTARAARIGF